MSRKKININDRKKAFSELKDVLKTHMEKLGYKKIKNIEKNYSNTMAYYDFTFEDDSIIQFRMTYPEDRYLELSANIFYSKDMKNIVSYYREITGKPNKLTLSFRRKFYFNTAKSKHLSMYISPIEIDSVLNNAKNNMVNDFDDEIRAFFTKLNPNISYDFIKVSRKMFEDDMMFKMIDRLDIKFDEIQIDKFLENDIPIVSAEVREMFIF